RKREAPKGLPTNERLVSVLQEVPAHLRPVHATQEVLEQVVRTVRVDHLVQDSLPELASGTEVHLFAIFRRVLIRHLHNLRVHTLVIVQPLNQVVGGLVSHQTSTSSGDFTMSAILAKKPFSLPASSMTLIRISPSPVTRTDTSSSASARMTSRV